MSMYRDTMCSQCYRWMHVLSDGSRLIFCDDSCARRYYDAKRLKYPDDLSFRLRRTDAVNELFVFTEKMRRESADNQKLLVDWHASYRDSIQRSYDFNALYRWLAHAVKDCVGETDVKFFRTKEEGGGIAWNRLDGVLTENSGRKAQLDALRLVYAAFWI